MKATLVSILLVIPFVLVAQEFSVLTYNIKYDNPKDSVNNWANRKDFMIDQLLFYGPDIFGTQEALVHQLKDLESGLPNYKYIGVGRDQGDDEGEFSAIFYNTATFEVIENDTFWLSETPAEPSKGWDAAIKRICTYGLFQDKQSGMLFYVFNTHFDHIGKKARLESAKLILAKINAINSQKLPIVLMGDFNLEPDAMGIELITEQLRDADVLAGKRRFGPSGTFNGFHFDKPVTRRIDYIFLSQDLIVEKYAVLSDNWDLHYPSDHLPVYALLTMDR